ncbi:MAG: TylF/MycF/NovP-related O-methyltransferase [Gemmatimonadaceae bacterium]
MIELPDFSKDFLWENNFYLSCDITRISKIVAHYELFRMTQGLAGEIVECGVFKGASLARFAAFREIFGSPFSRKVIGFDTFGSFPETAFGQDFKRRDGFIAAAGDQSISVEQMQEVLEHKGCARFVELVPGDITKTVPAYVAEHPELRISLLNLDTDIYEPAVTILEHLFPLIVPGGILVLDDYGVFPGETKAVDDYFRGRAVEIRKFPFCMTPCFVVKDAPVAEGAASGDRVALHATPADFRRE